MKTKRIQVKDLKPGAKIKSYDYQTNQIVFRTVEKVWSTVVQPHNQRLVEFNNGIGIKCSTKHPFMNDQAQQLLPDAINSSDLIVTDQTNPATMVSVSAINQDPMFIDLQVEDTHTFFASDSATGPMVLTHNSQGGIRNSSATINYPIWHYQFEDLIVLKNNKGTEETRVRHMDYAVAISALFYRRLKNNQSITLFDPNEVPDLYEAFYRDIDLFERLYCEYENRTDLTTKVLPAEVIIKEMLLAERGDTGRIYLVNIDNVQRQGPIDTKLHPIYQTNLCIEENQTVTVFNVELGTVDVEIKLVPALCEQYEPLFVLSYNEDLGIEEFNMIEAAGLTDGHSELVEVIDHVGGRLVCTPNHPVYTINRGYVEAQHLVSTDSLLIGSTSKSQSTHEVIKINKLTRTAPVYDLTVRNSHNFFASGILVHNCVEILLHTEPFQRLDDVGYLDIELNGQSIRIDNASVATLADGSKKQAYHILESDDVVSFELPDGQIIIIE